MGINSSTETGSNNDENSDEDGLSGSKRARQPRSSIENNAENSNNSSNLQNNASYTSSGHTYGLRGNKNEESHVITKEKRGGWRSGSGRKSAASNNMDADDCNDDNNNNNSSSSSSNSMIIAGLKREENKRDKYRLQEIEQASCRIGGSPLTLDTCLLLISLFAQRYREALTIEGVDEDLYKTKFDYETNPPRKLFYKRSLSS